MTLIFYDDNPLFTGHEATTLHGIEALLDEPDLAIHFIACEENTTLLKNLRALAPADGRLTIEETHETTSSLEALRHRLCRGRIADLAAEFRNRSADALVAVQNTISHSSLGLLAARKAGLRALSYIALPHSHAEMSGRPSDFRDLSTPPLFRLPDAFITLSDELARHLRHRGASCPIHVVPPGIDTERFQPRDRAAARAALSLPPEGIVFGSIGRIDFSQKQQNLLVEAIALTPGLAECRLIFAGDGPDAGELDRLIEDLDLSRRVRRLPWIDPTQLYPALDALVLPSRFEGMPLVMPEALACGIPVLGSDLDSMRDLLPDSCRFAPGDPVALGDALKSFVAAGAPPPPEALVRSVRESMNLSAFAHSFREAVLHLARP